ncbi:ENTH domain-containing protein [Mycena indigotica]|uniref:ENTH domain-containing protein n=1 Tax=Mycena indigotica TaxID=2126181 RepID=A0A8H6T398_9AGAR|nr:ENTH domain-containing protein [Mycena indigotica]KAF7310065.1 ENTH domain-containing protein [Mycena indigotica]
MSSYEKVVKGACKPKAAPPKAKYLDPIIAATWDEGGAVHDVCKALSPRFREPNAVVVLKALIVLHTMIRNGSTDNVLGYLSGSSVLRLHNVSAGNWDGYSAPENLQHYASYLDSRIKSYRDLKHDAIRVQSDSNRDARVSAGLNGGPIPKSTPLQRSKTLAGRKLRSMTVEKGLLRETRVVHGMIDTLVACRFYLDDLEDPLTLTALRMLVKDLLILFQAGNEGVINLLEHYFEMSHIDAKEALGIYRHFCTQTEQVVEYLGVARKLQNLLNVPIPNLKHAPVSLAGALQEYLDDPAFEQNRIEYKTNKEAVKRGRNAAKSDTPPVPTLPSPASSSTTKVTNGTASTSSNGATASGSKTSPDELVDFFAEIEQTQPTMFNPATNSPNTAYFQQMASSPNPFQRMQPTGAFGPQPTGAFGPQPTGAFGLQPTGAFSQPQLQVPGMPMGGLTGGLQPQATGFNPFSGARPISTFGPLTAQATGMGAGAFGGPPAGSGAFGLAAQPTGAFGSPLQQQPTQTPPFLRPQITGGAANPFRASQFVPTPMPLSAGSPPQLRPQMTGGAGAANPFRASMMFSQGTGPAAFNSTLTSSVPSVPAVPPFLINNTNSTSPGAGIPRPASAPLTALSPVAPSLSALTPTTTSSPGLQPVKSHQTGTKNPFGAPAPKPEDIPAIPRQPTLMELAMGGGPQPLFQSQPTGLTPTPSVQIQPTGLAGSAAKAFDYSKSALGPGATDMGSIASEFAFSKPTSATTAPSSTASDTGGSSLFSSFTGTTTATSIGSPSIAFSTSSGSLSSPTSSFGGGFDMSKSALNNPSSPLSASTIPNSLSSISSSSTLSAQTTGLQGFKPSSSFGASLLSSLPTIPGSPASPSVSTTGVTAQPTGFFSSGAGTTPTTSSAFGAFGTNPTGIPQVNPTTFSPAAGNFGQASTGPGGSTLGVGLRPQMTGGAANPFRASMAMGGPMPPMPTGAGAFGPGQPSFTGGAFGGGAFGGAFGNQQQPTQQQNGSLI